MAANFRFSKTTPIFAVNLALNERPKYITEEKHPEVAGSFMHIVGLDEYQDLVNLFEDCRTGQLPRKPFMNGATPSFHDPTQAPPGKATAFMWQLMTYNLWGNPLNWDKARHEWFYKQLAVWQKFAPNLDENNILSTDSTTPLDIERHDKNMYCGDWMVGEYSGDQALENRPFPGWGQYRTPIDGLFMCGSSCHPGGNITGAPGYNAAKVIAESLGHETLVEASGLPRTSQGADMKKIGVMEYWSTGVMGPDPILQHSITPYSRRCRETGGRVAIVTGGARHIGAAYCRRFAEEGAAVVIADILDGDAVADEIRAKGGKAMALNIDVSKEEDTNRMAAEAVKAFGRIDILVNNAAIFINIQRHPFYEISADEWDRVSAVNIKGPFLCAKAVFPQMKEQKKRQDHQHLVFDGLLGHAELSSLRRLQSRADRHDPLAGARSRRVTASASTRSRRAWSSTKDRMRQRR